MSPVGSSPRVIRDLGEFYVRSCESGVIHLAFGACTVHLSSDAFCRLADVLEHLAERVREQSRLATSPPAQVIEGRFGKEPE